MEGKVEVKDIMNHLKKQVQNLQKIKNSLNKNKINLEYHQKLKEAENTYVYDNKIKEETQTIKELEKTLKIISKKLEKNTYLFNITVHDLVKLVSNKLSKDYPNDKTYAICENLKQEEYTQEDFYGDRTICSYSYQFGVELEKSKNRFLFPVFYGDAFCSLDAIDIYMNLTTTKYYYNLLGAGFLTSDVKDFMGKDWENLFWDVVENNIKNRIKEITDNRDKEIYRQQQIYQNNLEELLR